jgi:hypothetical protein
MLPTIVAYPLALLPFAALAGALIWMATTSHRPKAEFRR